MIGPSGPGLSVGVSRHPGVPGTNVPAVPAMTELDGLVSCSRNEGSCGEILTAFIRAYLSLCRQDLLKLAKLDQADDFCI